LAIGFTQKIAFLIAEADIVVKKNIFVSGLKFQADLSPPSAD
jgi:hypothetical protein